MTGNRPDASPSNHEARPASAQRAVRAVGVLAAWAWTLVAGLGGFLLLLYLGPWPLTTGWFAMFSGLTACPLLPR
jgi:hypothetical protein